jgi:hypothetical protein
MRKIIYTAVAAAAVLAGSAAVAAPALASDGPGHSRVVASTYSPLHRDTTSVTGTATQASPGGPVWAYDDLHERFVVKPETSPGNYSLTVTVRGQFHGFADPRMASEGSTDPGGILGSEGQVRGTIQYDIQSSQAPDPSALPRVEPAGTGLGAAISQLFGGSQTTVGGGHYTFNYYGLPTAYSQVG